MSDITKKDSVAVLSQCNKFRTDRMIRTEANTALNATARNAAECLRASRACPTKTKKD
jgi:hypothetical protein